SHFLNNPGFARSWPLGASASRGVHRATASSGLDERPPPLTSTACAAALHFEEDSLRLTRLITAAETVRPARSSCPAWGRAPAAHRTGRFGSRPGGPAARTGAFVLKD